MNVSPDQLHPSQDYLKPGTISFILKCYGANRLDDLPPSPIVRKDDDGNLIAIDGHNLIAVKLHKGEHIDIHLAESADDGLLETSEANMKRNSDLKAKFESILHDRAATAASGVDTFRDLIARYPDIFTDQARSGA